MEPLLPQPGSSIDPGNAVGRGDTTRSAWDELRAQNNLCLNDPRRMGKTVWLDLFCASPGDGIVAVKIDYEGVGTSEKFLLRTVDALREHGGLPTQARAKLRALFDGVEVSAGPVTLKAGVSTRSPMSLLEDTVRSVEDHLEENVLFVIAMDEVPLALSNIASSEGPESANRLLQTLRELRRRRVKTGLRWIVCGSIGFHHILRRCRATTGAVNDLVNLPLGPLDPVDAAELAQRLLLGIQRQAGEGAVAALVEQSGSIPFLIHALAHRLQDAGAGPASASDVEDAFMDFMDDRDDSRAVTHLVTRLDPLYGPQARAAEAILDRIAIERSVVAGDLRADACLLDDLVDDHYLIERRGSLRWRYEVLRRIWAHRRRLG